MRHWTLNRYPNDIAMRAAQGPLRRGPSTALALLIVSTLWAAVAQAAPPAAGPPGGIRVAQLFAPRRPGIRIGNNGNANPANEEGALDTVFLPPDRNLKKRLEDASDLLEKGHFGEAVRKLGSLLESSEDYFFRPDPAQQVYRSLKAEAGRLISEMPAEGRDSYELQFGAGLGGC